MNPQIVIATPFVEDNCRASYHGAQWQMMKSGAATMIDPKILLGMDVERVRARAVRVFLREFTAEFLLLWDADVAGQCGRALTGMVTEDVPMIAATYPKKLIDWDAAAEAVRAGKHPEDGAYQYCMRAPEGAVNLGSRADLGPRGAVGCGFMLLRRDLLVGMCERFADRYFHDEGERTVDLFNMKYEDVLTEQSGVIRNKLPEDFSFCQRVVEHGEKVWLYTGPGAPLDHVGVHTFHGRPAGVLRPSS
jgi:hypothetical protein